MKNRVQANKVTGYYPKKISGAVLKAATTDTRQTRQYYKRKGAGVQTMLPVAASRNVLIPDVGIPRVFNASKEALAEILLNDFPDHFLRQTQAQQKKDFSTSHQVSTGRLPSRVLVNNTELAQLTMNAIHATGALGCNIIQSHVIGQVLMQCALGYREIKFSNQLLPDAPGPQLDLVNQKFNLNELGSRAQDYAMGKLEYQVTSRSMLDSDGVAHSGQILLTGPEAIRVTSRRKLAITVASVFKQYFSSLIASDHKKRWQAFVWIHRWINERQTEYALKYDQVLNKTNGNGQDNIEKESHDRRNSTLFDLSADNSGLFSPPLEQENVEMIEESKGVKRVQTKDRPHSIYGNDAFYYSDMSVAYGATNDFSSRQYDMFIPNAAYKNYKGVLNADEATLLPKAEVSLEWLRYQSRFTLVNDHLYTQFVVYYMMGLLAALQKTDVDQIVDNFIARSLKFVFKDENQKEAHKQDPFFYIEGYVTQPVQPLKRMFMDSLYPNQTPLTSIAISSYNYNIRTYSKSELLNLCPKYQEEAIWFTNNGYSQMTQSVTCTIKLAQLVDSYGRSPMTRTVQGQSNYSNTTGTPIVADYSYADVGKFISVAPTILKITYDYATLFSEVSERPNYYGDVDTNKLIIKAQESLRADGRFSASVIEELHSIVGPREIHLVPTLTVCDFSKAATQMKTVIETKKGERQILGDRFEFLFKDADTFESQIKVQSLLVKYLDAIQQSATPIIVQCDTPSYKVQKFKYVTNITMISMGYERDPQVIVAASIHDSYQSTMFFQSTEAEKEEYAQLQQEMFENQKMEEEEQFKSADDKDAYVLQPSDMQPVYAKGDMLWVHESGEWMWGSKIPTETACRLPLLPYGDDGSPVQEVVDGLYTAESQDLSDKKGSPVALPIVTDGSLRPFSFEPYNPYNTIVDIPEICVNTFDDTSPYQWNRLVQKFREQLKSMGPYASSRSLVDWMIIAPFQVRWITQHSWSINYYGTYIRKFISPGVSVLRAVKPKETEMVSKYSESNYKAVERTTTWQQLAISDFRIFVQTQYASQLTDYDLRHTVLDARSSENRLSYIINQKSFKDMNGYLNEMSVKSNVLWIKPFFSTLLRFRQYNQGQFALQKQFVPLMDLLFKKSGLITPPLDVNTPLFGGIVLACLTAPTNSNKGTITTGVLHNLQTASGFRVLHTSLIDYYKEVVAQLGKVTERLVLWSKDLTQYQLPQVAELTGVYQVVQGSVTPFVDRLRYFQALLVASTIGSSSKNVAEYASNGSPMQKIYQYLSTQKPTDNFTFSYNTALINVTQQLFTNFARSLRDHFRLYAYTAFSVEAYMQIQLSFYFDSFSEDELSNKNKYSTRFSDMYTPDTFGLPEEELFATQEYVYEVLYQVMVRHVPGKNDRTPPSQLEPQFIRYLPIDYASWQVIADLHFQPSENYSKVKTLAKGMFEMYEGSPAEISQKVKAKAFETRVLVGETIRSVALSDRHKIMYLCDPQYIQSQYILYVSTSTDKIRLAQHYSTKYLTNYLQSDKYGFVHPQKVSFDDSNVSNSTSRIPYTLFDRFAFQILSLVYRVQSNQQPAVFAGQESLQRWYALCLEPGTTYLSMFLPLFIQYELGFTKGIKDQDLYIIIMTLVSYGSEMRQRINDLVTIVQGENLDPTYKSYIQTAIESFLKPWTLFDSIIVKLPRTFSPTIIAQREKVMQEKRTTQLHAGTIVKEFNKLNEEDMDNYGSLGKRPRAE